jgi:hypothetical protein
LNSGVFACKGLTGGLGRNHIRAFAGHSGDFPEKLLHKLLQTAPQTLNFSPSGPSTKHA